MGKVKINFEIGKTNIK